METMAQIKSHLKILRLRSFIDNLEQRNAEAIQSKMSYIDFLLSLSQDEIDSRPHKKKIMDLATCQFIKQNENIIIYSFLMIGA